MKKILKFLAIILLIGLVYSYFTIYPKLDLVNGFSSKSIASHYFIANRSQLITEKEDNNLPSMDMATSVLDINKKTVSSKAWIFKKRTTKFYNGLGSILIPEGKENEEHILPQPKRTNEKILKPFPIGHLEPIDTVFANIDYDKIKKAVTFAFEEKHHTRSVLVLYKGNLITEKYATNFDKNSLILGWSMAKSITSTVIGVLTKKGKVTLEQKGLFPEWKDDERKNITLKNLLNMNSGLEWEEKYDKICDVTRMLFIAPKMGKIQLEKQLSGKPNESWNYSSGTSNLLSEFVRHQFTNHQDYLDFWYTNLIDKIGMHSMLLESDYSGTFVGSSYAWATTRDWAKFGQFYLQNGNWNGEQIISKSWVDFTRKPTNTSNGKYGGHFWLNSGGYYPDAPKDIYSCNGFQGQRVFIIPSKDMIVVRTGLSEGKDFDMNFFLSELVGSLE